MIVSLPKAEADKEMEKSGSGTHENLEDLSVEEVMEQFDATREQIIAVLHFVAKSLKASAPAKDSTRVDAYSL
jgi:hypothetical protein